MLFDQLPNYYQASAESRAIQESLEPDIFAAWNNRDSLLEQAYVDTSTWGLALWENLLGLEIDPSKSASDRRSRIKSKLRGQGTVTRAMLQNMAESFSGGETEIIEHSKENRFEIRFMGGIGTPPNMRDLIAALNDIKPAHLKCEFLYRYLIIREIHQVKTIEEMLAIEIDKFAGGRKDA